MLFESAHVRVTAEYGTATLWLNFPGDPVNALDVPRLRQLDAALAAVERNPFVGILVVLSGKPAGFCAGLHPDALRSLTTTTDRAAFAAVGQRVFTRLAMLPQSTVSFIDGPCLGTGLELALACDHRLCVARPTTHLGFPDGYACFGGSTVLPRVVGRRVADQLFSSCRTLSGREARDLGLVDHAFCERRSKIELRTYLDTLERRGGWKQRVPTGVGGHTAERRRFAHLDAGRLLQSVPPRLRPANPVPPFPAVVGLLGRDDTTAGIVSDAVLRGAAAVVCGPADGVIAGIAISQARGFVTTLEAEQAKARVTVAPDPSGFEDAGLVFVAGGVPYDDLAAFIRPRCIVAALGDKTPDDFPHPRRVLGLRFPSVAAAELVRHPDTDADAVAALAAWLTTLGFTRTVVPAARVATRLAA
jgi:enoyl-CoA hydratase/carnithine racemase